MDDHDVLLSTLSGLARTLLVSYDLQEVLQDLAERATDVLGVAGAGVSLI